MRCRPAAPPRAWLLAAGLLLAACGGDAPPAVSTEADAPRPDVAPPAPADSAALEPCLLPDFAGDAAAHPAADQLRRQHAALTEALADAGAAAEARSRDYGEMGKLLLGAGYPAAAEGCFRNAQALAPRDRRWPYYLGHVFRMRDQPAEATGFFEQALEMRPNDVPTLVWLADLHLAAGDPGAARPLLEHAEALQPDTLAVTFGLGRAALAREDWFRALQHLEAARALNPGAPAVLTALAEAWGRLGRLDLAASGRQQAQAAARAAASIDADNVIRPRDPLLDEAEAAIETAASFERRGVRALVDANPTRAASLFRSGLQLDPASLSLRHKLGAALAVIGDAPGAEEQFEQIVRQAPDHARAHHSLGLLLESTGQPLLALGRYSAAVRHDPDFVDARLQLARILHRGGRPDDAKTQYQWVMQLDPQMIEGPFEYAMVLVSQGHWAQARDRLAEGLAQHPHAPAFPMALARVLAAAPDASVRDGRRALEVLETLPDEAQRNDLGETMAMTLAELGRFDEAATWQREAIAGAREAGNEDLATRMAANLERYEARQPARTPWRDGELP